jgi:flagellar biosynthesis/type III secretory pathway M-ring protein FliF/YscJ
MNNNKIIEKFSELSGNEILAIILSGILGTLVGVMIFIWVNSPN